MEARRLRVLCLHGHGDNAQQLRAQLEDATWDAAVLSLLDLDFLDAPFQVQDDTERDFAPPYLQWFQCNPEMTRVNMKSFEQGVSCISHYMEKHGPFDGLLGLSQGGFLIGALAGMQQKKSFLLPTNMKFAIIICGGIVRCEPLSEVYNPPIEIHSFHLIGEYDTNYKSSGEELASKFVRPIVVKYPYGHCFPPLDRDSTAKLVRFLQQMLEERSHEASPKA